MTWWSFPERRYRTVKRTGTETVAYVRSLPELGTTLLLGGLLWGYGVWLVLPGLLVMGFFVRILRHVPSSPDDEDVTVRPASPPQFDDWLSLFVDGIRVYVVWTVYLFLAFTAAIPYGGEGQSTQLFVILLRTLLGNVGFLVRVRAALGVDEYATASVGGVVDLPGLALFLVSMYVAPAALLNLAARGSLYDGFAFEEIRAILVSKTYAARWVVFVLLWLASTVVLYLPSAAAVAVVVPDTLPVLAGVLRESLELLRGVLSFALLGLGYVVLGRVAVPPTDRPSVRGVVRAVYGTRLGSLVRREAGFGRTLLIASLLAVFWSLPAVVLLSGYLVRFVRAVSLGETPPRFDRPGTLVVEGVRAVGLWLMYMSLPVVSLVVWWTNEPIDGRLLTALTGVPGLGLGTWYLGRDYFNLLARWLPVHFESGGSAVVFGVLSLVALYVFPAAVVRVARERRLVSGLAVRSLSADVSRLSYALVWVRATALLALAAGLSLSWNWWRLGQPGFDTESLVSIAGVNLVSLPTHTGALSSLYLFAASAVGVLFLFRAYGAIATAVGKSVDSPREPPSTGR
jgi:hypothetical protein